MDTPGQDIFFRMRNYGAEVADFAILMVSAEDGVCTYVCMYVCIHNCRKLYKKADLHFIGELNKYSPIHICLCIHFILVSDVHDVCMYVCMDG